MNYDSMDQQGLKRKFLDPTDAQEGQQLMRGAPRRRLRFQNQYAQSVFPPIQPTDERIFQVIRDNLDVPENLRDALLIAYDQPGFGPGLRHRLQQTANTVNTQGLSGRFFQQIRELVNYMAISVGPVPALAIIQLLRTHPGITNALGGGPGGGFNRLPAVEDNTVNQYVRLIQPLIKNNIYGDKLANRDGNVRSALQGLNDFNKQRYFNSYYLKEDYLNAFPQWIGKNIKAAQKQKDKLTNQVDIQRNVANPNHAPFVARAEFDPQLAFDPARGRWVGSALQKMVKTGQKKAIRLQKSWRSGNELLQKSISAAQAKQQVPQFINGIIKANSNLSNTGFGPIAAGSSSLYAGRWMDSVTGKIRVLPSANQKYINPAVKQQKLGYLQAKILNHWNQCVSSYDQYIKLKQSNKDFAASVGKSIQNSLDMGNTFINYVNFIYRTLVTFSLDPQAATAKAALLRGIRRDRFQALFAQIGQMPVQDTQQNRTNVRYQTAANQIINFWQTQLTQRQLDLQDGMAALPNAIERQQATYKLSKAYLSLVGFAARKLRGAFNKLLRLSIPKKISYAFINQGMQQMDRVKSQYNQVLNQPNFNAITAANVRQLRGTGQQLGRKIQMGTNTPAQTKATLNNILQMFRTAVPARLAGNVRYPTLKDINNRAFRPGVADAIIPEA